MADEQLPGAEPLATRIAFSAMQAGMGALLLMAKRGLVAPAEVEEYFESLLVPLHPSGDDDPRAGQLATLRGVIEAHHGPVFALIREEARRTWQGE